MKEAVDTPKQITDNLKSPLMSRVRDLLIIGSGPAGLTAGIYGAREGLDTTILAGETPGGQLMWTSLVENFPGFPEGIDGQELMERMTIQASRSCAEILNQKAQILEPSDGLQIVKTDSEIIPSRAVIIASGGEHRLPQIEGITEFLGKGVSICAICDAPLYKDKSVVVIGSGDTALTEAFDLSNFASEVIVLLKGSEPSASEILKERVTKSKKIKFVPNAKPLKVNGDNFVESITLETENGLEVLKTSGIFVGIGQKPSNEFIPTTLLDENGYVKTDDGVTTNAKGIFTAGDITSGKIKQAITSAGDGARAALEASKFIRQK